MCWNAEIETGEILIAPCIITSINMFSVSLNVLTYKIDYSAVVDSSLMQ